ncbi:MAG: hypothetical protein RQ748_00690, partial [Elusimicrobiales bacterium]|nr:hypothetical protein [Elusimicrobiales bacterium]
PRLPDGPAGETVRLTIMKERGFFNGPPGKAPRTAGRPPVYRMARTDLLDEKVYFVLESFAAPGGRLSFAEYRRVFGSSFPRDFAAELPALYSAGCRRSAAGLLCPPTALSSVRRLLWRGHVLTGIAASLKEAGPGWVK